MDFREIKVKIWRQKAVIRAEWARVMKDAKVLGGPLRQVVSKLRRKHYD